MNNPNPSCVLFAAAALTLMSCAAAATPPARAVVLTGAVHQPISIASTPADPAHIYVCERPGVIKVVNKTTGVLRPAPLLDITPLVNLDLDNGLLCMAFDPDYAANRFFYINYNDQSGNIVLARYTVPIGTFIADPASVHIVWRYPRPLGHNGGWIGFSPLTNHLHITSGDGDVGALPDPTNRAQTLVNQRMGKLFRIDPRSDDFAADPERNYAIPPTNPLVNLAGDDEIWAYGVRNPWRGSFDRLTGDFYFGDVGSNDWEELNFEPASDIGGRNYGWPCMEGAHCTTSNACACNDPSLTLPIHDYPHPAGTAITGGYVYRGSAIPAFQGLYFFADLLRSKVWSMRVQPTGAFTEFTDRSTEFIPAGTPTPINFVATFGEDSDGELYIANLFASRIYKVVPYPCQAIVDASPLSQSVRAGVTVTLRVFGAGADPLTFRWRRDGVDLADGGRIQGSGTSILTITNVQVSDAGSYVAYLDSPCGNAASAAAVLDVFTCFSADVNDDNTLSVQDIFDFLAAFFSFGPAGDFNMSGQVSVQDIFDFLTAYFAGCV